MYDTIMIGAGPAGLSASIASAEQGLSVLVLDEYMKPGGRLLGQLYEEPTGGWWNGIEESAALYEQAEQAGVNVVMQTSVTNIENENDVWTVYTNGKTYETKHLLLATGAAESPIPIPGWTLPGVMSVGAAQVMTNVHRVQPGDQGVIIGVNVLSAAIAMELQLAGCEVLSMTLPKQNALTYENAHPKDVMESLLHVSHMAPSAIMRWGSSLMKNDLMKQLGLTFYPKRGFKMMDIPIQLRKAVTAINGNGRVESVTLASINTDGSVIPGSEEDIACDFVCISGGLYPLVELGALTECPFYRVEELGGYVPVHNERMETPLQGLYVAGNITGIEGAKVAIKQGKTAGLTIAANAGVDCLDEAIATSIEHIKATRDEAYIQFHPDVKKGKEIIQKQWELNQAKAAKEDIL